MIDQDRRDTVALAILLFSIIVIMLVVVARLP